MIQRNLLSVAHWRALQGAFTRDGAQIFLDKKLNVETEFQYYLEKGK